MERRKQELLCYRMIPERMLRLVLLGNKKCLMYGCSAVSSGVVDGGTVFAGLILACLARCGFCGGGPFATSTVRLSGYCSSGVLRFMRR